jgi:serine phosphatase RsbU (regulator of sigma subunit)
MNKKFSNHIDKKNNDCWQARYDNPQVVLKNSIATLLKAEKNHYSKGIAYAKVNISVASFLNSKNDKALVYLSEALQWFSANTSEQGYIRALNLKGSIYESFGDYETATQFCLQAHRLASGSNDLDTLAEICSQLGLIYTRLCNFKKALDFYKEGLHIRETLKDENGLASSYNRIGMLMRLMKKNDESLLYYQKSLEIRIKNKQISSIPWTMLGLASTYEEMQKFNEALSHYKSGMIAADIRCYLQCRLGSGRILSRLGDIDLAEEFMFESLNIAKELKALSILAEIYSALANHFESTGHFDKALKNFRLFQKTKDAVQNDEVQNRIKNIEISHAVEKSEREKEIFRLKHVELKNAYDIIEEKNKDITASIKYASRIQGAILPTQNELQELSKNCFVFYQPKDIVSGDFYWIKRIENKIIIVVADCTGHGVPGALMSMLGISFLEEIVSTRLISESGPILDALRNEIQRSLHQSNDSSESKDGMDISLCVIDQNDKNIQYSGAFNNLYLIRKNELLEFKADRMPIGISGNSYQCFTTQRIKINTGDWIYMFSDGFADQFGGQNNKKFKYTSLKELLLRIYKLPILKQKSTIEKEFNEWKGTNTQTDDVLILGLKL